MRNFCHRCSKLYMLFCILLFCALLSGCVQDGNTPRMDIISELTIQQLNDYYQYNHPEKTICYDQNAFYFLRSTHSQNVEICRASRPNEVEVLYKLYNATDIANWDDKLVIRGQTTAGSKESILLLNKQDPTRNIETMIGLEKEKSIVLASGENVEADISPLPLRFIFNDKALSNSLECLLTKCTNYRISNDYSKEEWKHILDVLGMPLNENSDCIFQNLWLIKTDNWLLEFRKSEDNSSKFSLECMHFSDPSGGLLYVCSGESDHRFINYADQLFIVNAQFRDPILNNSYEPLSLQAISRTKKSNMQLDVGKEYFLRKQFSGQNQRMQYFVFSKYYVEEVPNEYYKYIQNLIGHKILAIDLETMQLTKELTLSTPREQVLHVNEAGAYTWRQEESRIFFTPWQGEAVAVSDVIPYVPRYETPQDEKENDACNVWYAEVDAARNRLLLFDMTQGETALLAVVDLPY